MNAFQKQDFSDVKPDEEPCLNTPPDLLLMKQPLFSGFFAGMTVVLEPQPQPE
jgi:hypothetical protein